MAKKKDREEVVITKEDVGEMPPSVLEGDEVLGTENDPITEETAETATEVAETAPEQAEEPEVVSTPPEDSEEGSEDPIDPVMEAGKDVETVPPPAGSRAASLEDKVRALAGAVEYLAGNVSGQVRADVKTIYSKAFED